MSEKDILTYVFIIKKWALNENYKWPQSRIIKFVKIGIYQEIFLFHDNKDIKYCINNIVNTSSFLEGFDIFLLKIKLTKRVLNIEETQEISYLLFISK